MALVKENAVRGAEMGIARQFETQGNKMATKRSLCASVVILGALAANPTGAQASDRESLETRVASIAVVAERSGNVIVAVHGCAGIFRHWLSLAREECHKKRQRGERCPRYATTPFDDKPILWQARREYLHCAMSKCREAESHCEVVALEARPKPEGIQVATIVSSISPGRVTVGGRRKTTEQETSKSGVEGELKASTKKGISGSVGGENSVTEMEKQSDETSSSQQYEDLVFSISSIHGGVYGFCPPTDEKCTARNVSNHQDALYYSAIEAMEKCVVAGGKGCKIQKVFASEPDVFTVGGETIQSSFELINEAVSRGRADHVKMLSKSRFELSRITRDGNTPLFSAVLHQRPDIVSILLDNMEEADINRINFNGESALTVAIKPGREDIRPSLVRLLSKKMDEVTIDHLDNDGYAPIHYGAIYDHGQEVRMLLDSGSDPNVIALNGYSALDLAEICGSERAGRFLREAGGKNSREAATDGSQLCGAPLIRGF